MILTVTLNPALDKILLVDKVMPRTTVRAREVITDIGGKGTHVAWVLGKMGIDNTALGLLAGETGIKIEKMLRDVGVETEFTWQEEGESRNSIIVIEDDGNSWMFAENGYDVFPSSVKSVLAKVSQFAKKGNIMVLSGGVPPTIRTSIYAEMTEIAKEAGCLTILDASGEYLREGLKASPDIAKPNQVELNQIYGTNAESIEDIAQLGQRVRTDYSINWMIVSLAERGCILLGDGVQLWYQPPKVEEVNSVGCGDVFVSGLTAEISKGKPVPDAVKFACALGSTAAMSITTSGHDLALAHKLLKDVQVSEINGGGKE